MINDPSCSISNHKWQEEGVHGFQSASRTKQETTKDQPWLQDSSDQRTSLMCLEETARRTEGPDKLKADADQDVSTMSYIATLSPSTTRGPTSTVGSTASPAASSNEGEGRRSGREEGGQRRETRFEGLWFFFFGSETTRNFLTKLFDWYHLASKQACCASLFCIQCSPVGEDHAHLTFWQAYWVPTISLFILPSCAPWKLCYTCTRKVRHCSSNEKKKIKLKQLARQQLHILTHASRHHVFGFVPVSVTVWADYHNQMVVKDSMIHVVDSSFSSWEACT
jgi:hypothetical protein